MLDTSSILLSDVIALVESSNNPHAMRFEAATYQSLMTGAMTPAHAAIVANIQGIHKCSQSTAQVIFSTSYGAYQIMGFNLYNGSGGTQEDIITFCSDSAEQTRLFNNFCIENQIAFLPVSLAASSQIRQYFGARYNGNGVAYAPEIAAALTTLGFTVTP